MAMLREFSVEFGLTAGQALADFKAVVTVPGSAADNGYASRFGIPPESEATRCGIDHSVYMAVSDVGAVLDCPIT